VSRASVAESKKRGDLIRGGHTFGGGTLPAAEQGGAKSDRYIFIPRALISATEADWAGLK